MIRNNFTIAWRDLRKHKGNAFVTIAGLAVGAACCLLIFLYVGHELSYDDYHQNRDRIFRLLLQTDFLGWKTLALCSELAAPTLKEDYPEVEFAARVHRLREPAVIFDKTAAYEDGMFYADQDIFQILTIPFRRGRSAGALERPGTVVLTESLAFKYFGNRDPMGQSLLINNKSFEVTGILEDPPTNTHLKYRGLMSFKSIESGRDKMQWTRYDFFTYLKVRPLTNIRAFASKVAHLSKPYLAERYSHNYKLQPLGAIHLDKSVEWDVEPHGNRGVLLLLAGLGFLILSLACLNFINLTTARAAGRAKEVGVRKTVGAENLQLIRQFLSESFLVTGISICIALALAGLVVQRFNLFAGTGFTLKDILSPSMMLFAVGLLLLTGLAAGTYPAFFLSSFKPVSVLRKDAQVRLKGGRLRQIFVVGQFMAAVVLMTVTLSMNHQIRHMKTEPLGFEIDQKMVLVLPRDMRGRLLRLTWSQVAALKEEFSRPAFIASTTLSSSVPGRSFFFSGTRLPQDEADQFRKVHYLITDSDFIKDYGLELVGGRAIRDSGADREILINETGMRLFGWTSADKAIGKSLITGSGSQEIVGVLRDFHLEGLQTAIKPLVMGRDPGQFKMMTLTFHADSVRSVLDYAGKTWKAFFPEYPLDSFFLDDHFAGQYRHEEKTAAMFSAFAGLGIVIACLGLFGLASFLSEKRRKEIGIRKVLGASDSKILILMSREFLAGILAAIILAWPTAYVIVSRWLRNFAYRSAPGAGIFLTSAALALAMTLLAVSFHTLSAARTDASLALRCE